VVPCGMPAIDPHRPLDPGSRATDFVTLGPGAISHGRGEENPKGTEQLELVQGNGVAGAATRSYRGDLALRCSPGAAARSKRGFFPAVSLI